MGTRFTDRAQKVIMIAQEEAKRLNHDYVGTEHILLGLVSLGEGVAAQVLNNVGVSFRHIRAEIEKMVGVGDNMMLLGEIPFTPRAKKVLEFAVEEAQHMGHSYIGTEHILLGLIREEEGVAARVLENLGMKLDSVRKAVLELIGETPPQARKKDSSKRGGQEDEEEETQAVSSASAKKSKTPTLDEFARDLTRMAAEKKLDPVIGRDVEIERLMQIIARRTKNNPVLIGEPGVGKTAIVERLAQKIVSNEVSDMLSGKRLLSLDLASIVAGTKYRGEFEQRLKTILEEIRKAKNQIILFIDELHTVVGAGAAEGAIDAFNMLKPPLARGELQCIGATTFDEYRKHIEHDPALERRFQPIVVDPPTVEESIEILHGLKGKYEEHHNVKFTDESLIAAATISDKYITDRALPDKAIDLLDEAGSRSRLKISTAPPILKEKSIKIEAAMKEKNEAIASQEYERAAKARDKEKQLKKSVEIERRKWQQEQSKVIPTVTEEDIAVVASRWTGIPVTKLTEGETEKLANMERYLHERIIGQEEAVTAVSKAIRRSRTGLKDPKRPIGGFLFLGPTGVGKTELARVLAEFLFGNEEAMVRVDMSEYMEKFAVSRLIGAPPGYVGYEEGGQLTEIVRRKPYSVVVLDEIEKAHPDIFNILLQVLDEGTLSDNLGHKVSFKNSIVIMTSNVGARLISKGKSLGFVAQDQEERNYTKMKDTVMDEVRRIFNPEFINRVDEIMVFHPLNEEHMVHILELMLKKVEEKLVLQNYNLSLSDKAKKFLVKTGFDPNFGARPLLRTIQRHLEDPLAEKLLASKGKEGGEILVDADEKDSKLVFEVKVHEKKEPEKKEVRPQKEIGKKEHKEKKVSRPHKKES
ncbi:MAG TPA: ATP-dependent Clp protease ATP-binding subunit [Elusimicrobiales bacterium]|nr:ATP-dependent Clp protease ATP-binding subunit [Elusimicrobiales bacterium]